MTHDPDRRHLLGRSAYDVPHTPLADNYKNFLSQPMDAGERYSFTFNRSGEDPYFCSIHLHINAKIIVKAS